MRKSNGEMAVFCREVSRVPLLTVEQEQETGRCLRDADQKIAKEARDLLIRANIRFVFMLAKRFQGRGIELPDLVQEGILGLIRAADDFDFSRGNRFTTYASHWIKQYIVRAIEDKGRLIRVPTYQRRLLRLWEKAPADPASALRGVVEAAKSHHIHTPRDATALAGLHSLRAGVVSLNDATMVPHSREIVSEEAASTNESLTEALEALRKLPPREASVLEMRCGLNGPPLSLSEIGEKWGVSRERVRQIEMYALQHLRRLLNLPEESYTSVGRQRRSS